MPLTNALLVRYQTGYVWVVDAGSIGTYERREGYLTLGAVASREEAIRVGEAVLAGATGPSEAVSVGVEPDGGDVPYVDFFVGDRVTVAALAGSPSLRVKSMTVTEDTEGNPIYTPELGAMRDERERLVARWLKRMSNGALGGTIESATPPLPPRAVGDLPAPTHIPPIVQDGSAPTMESGWYFPPQNTRIVGITASLVTAGDVGGSDTVVTLVKNGVDVHAVNLAPGVHVVTGTLSVFYQGPDADYLQIRTEFGSGAYMLVVQLRQG